MKIESNILTECYVDTLIVKTILFPQKGYNHKKGCNDVLKQMNDKFANQAVFGIIDDDKVIRNFDNFSLLRKHNEHLAIYKHNNKTHYIVKISKAAEDFIFHCAKQCSILLDDYNLPADVAGLKKITKHIDSLEGSESKFKKLFLDIKQNESSDFHKLAQWIELFKANPYNINIELL